MTSLTKAKDSKTNYLEVVLKNTFVFQAVFQPPRFEEVEGGARVFTALQRPYSPPDFTLS